MAAVNEGRRFNAPMPGQSANVEIAVFLTDPVEFFQTVDIDEHVRFKQPEVQHRHQALPAGQHLGRPRMRGEQGDGLLQRSGANVAEGRRLHGVPPPQRACACR
jgi:hypothetical protein